MDRVAGVDVGGTFTDLILIEEGNVRLAKVPTTPGNQALGAIAALEAAEVDLSLLDLLVHGTTTTTNAVLTRRLSRTGLITTAGFRDVLELGRRTRPAPYGMTGRFQPIIPRDLRLEVPERMDASGAVVTPLDEDAVRGAVARLLDAGCESLVIHFLHAYANPAHEQRAVEIAATLWPNAFITQGHALISESREFERGVTAAVNASVQPLLAHYVDHFARTLAARSYRHDLLVMNGNGGMVSAGIVAREAAKTVMSGPASGVMAAAYTGQRAGVPDMITYDMGGTSTDVALIRGAEPAVSNEIDLEYAMPIHVPMVDVRTVGAGGGSIARVDAGGLLQVGPDSAGAEPGPICYGKGGTEPTISDANLILGRLDPTAFLGTARGIEVADIRAIFAKRIGAPLGLDAEEAAAAVIHIANTRMAGAIRMVSISLGADPRDFALFAFGGAGPLHASALARELGIPRVLVPARPGITNALGCAVADLRHDFVQAVSAPMDNVDMTEVHETLNRLTGQGREMIAGENVRIDRVDVLYAAEMQFIGQTHLLRVALPSATPARAELQALFEAAYHARFHVDLPEIRANLVNLCVSVIGRRAPVDLTRLIDPGARRSLAEARTGTRRVRFDTWHDAPVYWRDHLPMDAILEGPGIVEQMDTTVLLHPGDRAHQDADGNLIVEVGT